ncbi:MAG: CoA protein activase [Firmicutes bacterium]|nr:CoA protein activase [Bacillota bacterium]
MKVTFPHLGPAHLALVTLFTDLGLEPVAPPPTTRRTIALGVRHAPEFACFPLKVNLGNYLEALAAGAEAIFMVGGVGPCRLGYYAQVQQTILRRLGLDLPMIVFEPPQRRWAEFWRAIRRVLPPKRLVGLPGALFFAYRKLAAIDELAVLVNRLRPRTLRPLALQRLWEEGQKALGACTEMRSLKRVLSSFKADLVAIPRLEEGYPLRMELAGEIYMVLEPAVNFELERRLGEKGVEVIRHLYLSRWLGEQFRRCLGLDASHHRDRELAWPYLAHPVGGHGLQSVARAVEAGVNRLDGMVHLAPFTCMPEIVAGGVLPVVREDLGLPILHLNLDEHTAEAGVLTRLEAFLDLAARRYNCRLVAMEGHRVERVFSRG